METDSSYFMLFCDVECSHILRYYSAAIVHTKAGFDEVFKACIDATVDIRFGVSSSDSKAGLIVAEKAVVGGHGTVVKLNIMVSHVSDITEVKVNYVPPPGTIGGGGTVDCYIKALKKRIPDVEVSAVK